MIAKRILVPSDFSACSKTALQLAATLAKGSQDSTVTLLHVVQVAVPTYEEDLGVLEPERLRTELEALAASANYDVPMHAEVRHGDPAKEILDFAEQHAVDLIVMGTHGRHRLVDVLVGSTAEEVMRDAKIPVLNVRVDSVLPALPQATGH